MNLHCVELRQKSQLFQLLIVCLCIFLAQAADDGGELEPFEPFAFELETDDEIGFTSNHKHALIGTSRPPSSLENSLPGQFPINSGAAKGASLVPDSAKLKKDRSNSESTSESASQEFQRDGSHEKVSEDRLVTSTEFLLDPNLNSSKNTELQLCDSPQDTPTFIKHSRVSHKSLPKMTRKMDNLNDCAENCRNKVAINGEEPFDCHGFTFLGRQADNKCEFYENHNFEYSPVEKSTYFERICLKIPHECKNSAYSFEVQPERYMPTEPIKEQVVENRKQCLDLCLESPGSCRAVNHNKINGTCQLLDKASQNFMMSLSENLDFEFYEYRCIQDRQRCEAGHRMDFVVTKNTQVNLGTGLDINLGSLSIANCMRSCVESTLIFCRSFQYDSITRECLLVEETGANAARSENFDLYEPICLNNEIDVPCPGDRVFERVPKHNLISDDVLAHLKDISLGSCMEACLFDENCLSFTYHRPERRCKILPLNSRNNQTLSVVETSIDYYELACDRKAILKNQQILAETAPLDSFTTRRAITTESDKRLSPTQSTATAPSVRHACDLSQSVIIESGRTLRIDYRNLHHVNVHSLERCQSLCAEASIKCTTFAFNHKTGDCLLSSTNIDKNNRFVLITQPNPNFDLYSFLGANACNYNDTLASTSLTTAHSTTFAATTNLPTTSPTSTIGELTATVFLQDPFDNDPNPVRGLTLSTHPTLVSLHPSTVSNQQLLREPKLERILDIDLQPKQTTRQLPIFTTPSQITRRPITSQTTEKPTPIETVITSTSQILPHRNKSIQRLPIQNIHVKAICLEQGVNVTFNIENNSYTGAVYAAERFSQCRVFVDGKDQFSLFVTRPSINSYCNALEEDGELTAVLVMSNDMVQPLDVTTKDDLYFQISCDYSKGEQNFLVRNGIVVGGPEPKSVASAGKKDEKPYRVSLKILKNQRPVSKVYIGEKLTAVVDSDLDATRLRVTDCNATRVGGREPRPNSIQLIRDGCSIMPQIMGDIVRGPLGLEAPFTAFRIDGSDQIDIVCGVVVCKHRCDDKAPHCPQNRNKRDADETTGSEMIIDQRLQVLVDERHENEQPIERNSQSLLNMILDMNDSKTQYCMSPLSVLISLLLFLCILVAFFISLTVLICRRRSMRFPYSNSRLRDQMHIPRIERYVPGSESF